MKNKQDGLKSPKKNCLPKGQKSCAIFFKAYPKLFLALSEKKMDQFITFFVDLLAGEPYFKNHQHSVEDILVQTLEKT